MAKMKEPEEWPRKLILPGGKFMGRTYPKLVLNRVIEGTQVHYSTNVPLDPVSIRKAFETQEAKESSRKSQRRMKKLMTDKTRKAQAAQIGSAIHAILKQFREKVPPHEWREVVEDVRLHLEAEFEELMEGARQTSLFDKN